MYAKWVHVMEAKRAGLKFLTIGPNWQRDNDVIYDPKQTPFLFVDGFSEYKKYGYWLSNRFMPDCTVLRLGKSIRIRGLIATYRRYTTKKDKLTFITLGSSAGQYWDVVVDQSLRLHGIDMIDLEGEVRDFFDSRATSVLSCSSTRITVEQTTLSTMTMLMPAMWEIGGTTRFRR
jgi:hypothetical protein